MLFAKKIVYKGVFYVLPKGKSEAEFWRELQA